MASTPAQLLARIVAGSDLLDKTRSSKLCMAAAHLGASASTFADQILRLKQWVAITRIGLALMKQRVLQPSRGLQTDRKVYSLRSRGSEPAAKRQRLDNHDGDEAMPGTSKRSESHSAAPKTLEQLSSDIIQAATDLLSGWFQKDAALGILHPEDVCRAVEELIAVAKQASAQPLHQLNQAILEAMLRVSSKWHLAFHAELKRAQLAAGMLLQQELPSHMAISSKALQHFRDLRSSAAYDLDTRIQALKLHLHIWRMPEDVSIKSEAAEQLLQLLLSQPLSSTQQQEAARLLADRWGHLSQDSRQASSAQLVELGMALLCTAEGSSDPEPALGLLQHALAQLREMQPGMEMPAGLLQLLLQLLAKGNTQHAYPALLMLEELRCLPCSYQEWCQEQEEALAEGLPAAQLMDFITNGRDRARQGPTAEMCSVGWLDSACYWLAYRCRPRCLACKLHSHQATAGPGASTPWCRQGAAPCQQRQAGEAPCSA